MGLTASNRLRALTEKIWCVPKEKKKKKGGRKRLELFRASFCQNAKMGHNGYRLMTGDIQQKRQAELV